jgi:hypothetical protein
MRTLKAAANTEPEVRRPAKEAPQSVATLPAVDVKSLHAKIGELTLENDFLEGVLTKAGLPSAKR